MAAVIERGRFARRAPPGATDPRIFMTAWFAKRARAMGITDDELVVAATELSSGLGENLGGNVWKKRLGKNTKRGLVINKVGERWIFVYVFAKCDRGNIDDRELRDFKKLARDYDRISAAEIRSMVQCKTLVEVRNG